MRSIRRIQGAVGQPEIGGRRVEGLDAQHPEDSRGGRVTGGLQREESSGGFKGNRRLQAEGWKVWLWSIHRNQAVVGQPEVGGTREGGGLDVQHPEDGGVVVPPNFNLWWRAWPILSCILRKMYIMSLQCWPPDMRLVDVGGCAVAVSEDVNCTDGCTGGCLVLTSQVCEVGLAE